MSGDDGEVGSLDVKERRGGGAGKGKMDSRGGADGEGAEEVGDAGEGLGGAEKIVLSGDLGLEIGEGERQLGPGDKEKIALMDLVAAIKLSLSISFEILQNRERGGGEKEETGARDCLRFEAGL